MSLLFPALDDTGMKPSSARLSLRRHMLMGGGVAVVVFVGLMLWLCLAQLSGAVVAGGHVVVESSVKDVQHPDGGIVGEIHVRDGDHVQAGDLLIRLDDTAARSSLGIVEKQLDALRAQRMRLVAERDGGDFLIPPGDFADRLATPEVRDLISSETRLFAARRTSLAGQKDQLRQKLKQLAETIAGLQARHTANEEQRMHIADELDGLEVLYAKQLVPITRVAELRREKAGLIGEYGELKADIAAARMQIGETEMAISQLDRDRQTEVLNDLSGIDQQVAELMQRRIALQDQVRRIDIRAPYTGTVYQLAVHTVGGVVGAGERIMGIVPDQDKRIVEVRLHPRDIDQVIVGQKAMLRFIAFNQRTTPELSGHVSLVSANLSEDERTGEQYFVVRIRLSSGELAKLNGQDIIPGMPVEAYIATGERTALSYLLKPLSDQFARAFRDD